VRPFGLLVPTFEFLLKVILYERTASPIDPAHISPTGAGDGWGIDFFSFFLMLMQVWNSLRELAVRITTRTRGV